MYLLVLKIFNNMKLGGVIIVFLLPLILNSCQKETPKKESLNDSICPFELDEERLTAVNEISNLFNEEFEATLNQTQIGSNQYVEKFATTLTDNFNIRLEKLQIDKPLKSTNIESDSINIKLQLYFDELSDLIIQTEYDENADKETVLANINKTVVEYIEWIKIDEKLTNNEKQIIIVKILL
jgi:hypothetical protein